MSSENGQVTLLIAQLQQAADTMRGTMEDVSDEVMHALPGGSANTIAANVAHAAASIDGVVHGILQGKAPLMMSEDTGMSTPPPQGFEWGDWGQTVQVNRDTFHPYIGKVMEGAIGYLGSLSDSDLERVAKSPTGNEMTVSQWFTILILNTAWHTGEIAALKGTHGLKGYQF